MGAALQICCTEDLSLGWGRLSNADERWRTQRSRSADESPNRVCLDTLNLSLGCSQWLLTVTFVVRPANRISPDPELGLRSDFTTV